MKKFLCLLFAVAGFLSCGDDDRPHIPELNKLTKVTCTKNGTAFFTADITYDQVGQINRIILDNGTIQYTDNYITVSNTISVNGTKVENSTAFPSFIHTVYTLNNNRIEKKEEMAENKYMNNVVYPAVTNSYSYNRSWLTSVSQAVQWPKEQGTGYEQRAAVEVDRYTWENSNAVRYAFLPLREITYVYESQQRPANFPLRVINTFAPVGFDFISPVNLLFGEMNRNLPVQAYWYNIADATNKCAEYTFRYVQSSDYISGMTIQEKINPVDGAKAEDNTYEYTFAYNYVVE